MARHAPTARHDQCYAIKIVPDDAAALGSSLGPASVEGAPQTPEAIEGPGSDQTLSIASEPQAADVVAPAAPHSFS